MANPAGADRLVVAVVGSPASDAAVRWAAGDAVMRGSAITLRHVVAPAVATLPLENDSSSHFHWREDYARTVVEKAEKTLWTAVDVSVAPAVRTEVHHDRVADRLASARQRTRQWSWWQSGFGLPQRQCPRFCQPCASAPCALPCRGRSRRASSWSRPCGTRIAGDRRLPRIRGRDCHGVR